ncbi:D(2) dopamine receptor A-like [Chiloscyllium plagiosum]|uniref:D(2) dopamine receptor A-like n=1 Tax=Chiloscyllium plagiosum TaxID=36176 RepID=UPI001CB7E4E2|nr:D(2) dopamine receptor A-like [Chiloscyllium plagiosum]
MATLNMAALNDTELMVWTNGTVDQCRPRYNYYAALLSLLIFTVVFGNVLVCLAVSRERALQTTTNYLIVSLAVADLLVATLVMPWVVYLEVVGEWRFGWVHCDIFVTLDVMFCTASILNLCAISIDRYMAVAMPMLYNTRYSSKRRVTLMITMVWALSFAISCPLLFGLKNHSGKTWACGEWGGYSCSLSSPVPVRGSLLSLRTPPHRKNQRDVQRRNRPFGPPKRENRRFIGHLQRLGTFLPSGSPYLPQLATLVREAMAGPEGAERAHRGEEPGKARPAGTPLVFQRAIASGSGLTAGKWEAPSSVEVSQDPERDGPGSFFRSNTLEVPRVMDEEQAPAVKEASRSKVSHQKEKKATQMLAIVLGESRMI